MIKLDFGQNIWSKFEVGIQIDTTKLIKINPALMKNIEKW